MGERHGGGQRGLVPGLLPFMGSHGNQLGLQESGRCQGIVTATSQTPSRAFLASVSLSVFLGWTVTFESA